MMVATCLRNASINQKTSDQTRISLQGRQLKAISPENPRDIIKARLNLI
jgi:hypothetical protein